MDFPVLPSRLNGQISRLAALTAYAYVHKGLSDICCYRPIVGEKIIKCSFFTNVRYMCMVYISTQNRHVRIYA